MKDKIETKYTEYPTCPHCGWEDRDYGDYIAKINEDEMFDIDCGNCEKVFDVYAQTNITFNSKSK